MHFKVKTVSEGKYFKVRGLGPSTLIGYSRSKAYQTANQTLSYGGNGPIYPPGETTGYPGDFSKCYKVKSFMNATGTELDRQYILVTTFTKSGYQGLRISNCSSYDTMKSYNWNKIVLEVTDTFTVWRQNHVDYTLPAGSTQSNGFVYTDDLNSQVSKFYRDAGETYTIVGVYRADGTEVTNHALKLSYSNYDNLAVRNSGKSSVTFARIDFKVLHTV